jgi:hypothetical protein
VEQVEEQGPEADHPKQRWQASSKAKAALAGQVSLGVDPERERGARRPDTASSKLHRKYF